MELPSPQRMRLIGSILGFLIFVVPLALLYVSMKSELSSPPREEPPARKEQLQRGPLVLEIAGRRGSDVELRFKNVSAGPLKIAVPAGPSGLLTFLPRGAKKVGTSPQPVAGSYAVIELLPGDSYSRLYKDVANWNGPVAVYYDSRLPGLPADTWSGSVEIP